MPGDDYEPDTQFLEADPDGDPFVHMHTQPEPFMTISDAITLKQEAHHAILRAKRRQPTGDVDVDEPPVFDPEEVDLLGVFPPDSTHGNNIAFDDWEERRVHGWYTKSGTFIGSGGPVEDGDRFGYEMDSGRVAVFELVDVEQQDDPEDMFFATARDIGYLQEEGDV